MFIKWRVSCPIYGIRHREIWDDPGSMKTVTNIGMFINYVKVRVIE